MNSNKSVLVDLSKSWSPYSGLGQFSYHLGRSLSAIDADGLQMSYLVKENYQTLFPEHSQFEFTRFYHKLGMPGPVKRLMQLFNPKFDLWHVTDQDSSYWPLTRTTPVVMTIHDLNFLVDKKSEAKIARRLKRLQARVDRAQCITTISQFSADTIRQHVDLRGKPLKVIYNGGIDEVERVELGAAELKSIHQRAGDKFLFTIGVVKEKKNFHVLLPLMKCLEDYKLVIAGNDDYPYAQFLRAEIARLNLHDRVELVGKVSNDQRAWLYQNCRAFIFPSIAEGFGIPVIEAMAYGKPVFISNHTSLPEVAGGEGYIFESFEAEDMAQVFTLGMSDFLADPNKEKRVVARAKSFNWKKAATEYHALYDALLS